jgi:hypothetical protein
VLFVACLTQSHSSAQRAYGRTEGESVKIEETDRAQEVEEDKQENKKIKMATDYTTRQERQKVENV